MDDVGVGKDMGYEVLGLWKAEGSILGTCESLQKESERITNQSKISVSHTHARITKIRYCNHF